MSDLLPQRWSLPSIYHRFPSIFDIASGSGSSQLDSMDNPSQNVDLPAPTNRCSGPSSRTRSATRKLLQHHGCNAKKEKLSRNGLPCSHCRQKKIKCTGRSQEGVCTNCTIAGYKNCQYLRPEALVSLCRIHEEAWTAAGRPSQSGPPYSTQVPKPIRRSSSENAAWVGLNRWIPPVAMVQSTPEKGRIAYGTAAPLPSMNQELYNSPNPTYRGGSPRSSSGSSAAGINPVSSKHPSTSSLGVDGVFPQVQHPVYHGGLQFPPLPSMNNMIGRRGSFFS